MGWLVEFLRDDDGVAAVEYAVILAMILMAIIGVVAGMGSSTSEAWQGICNDLDAVGFFR